MEKRNYWVSKVLATIVVGRNFNASREAANDALTVCNGHKEMIFDKVVKLAEAHWQFLRDLASDNDFEEPNVETSEEELEVESSEEEPLEEDPVNEGPVEGAVVEQQ